MISQSVETTMNARLICTNSKNDDKKLSDNALFAQLIDSLKLDEWKWDRQKTENIPLDVIFQNDDHTAIIHPSYSIGTAAVFGTRSLNEATIAYWEIYVPATYGTSMMFGIGRKTARTCSLCQFEPLIGGSTHAGDINNESMGLSHLGVLHGGKTPNTRQFCESLANSKPINIGIIFHGPEGWLAYSINKNPFKIAFIDIDLSSDTYYPMISSTAQRSVFTLRQQLTIKFCKSLSDICLNEVVKNLTTYFPEDIEMLNLPLHLSKSVINRMMHRKQMLVQEMPHNLDYSCLHLWIDQPKQFADRKRHSEFLQLEEFKKTKVN